MIYVTRRTQLYLDESLWNALHAHAATGKTTISELVREAVRERYFSPREDRIQAMQAFVGVRKDSATDTDTDAVEYLRDLRRGSRLDRLHKA